MGKKNELPEPTESKARRRRARIAYDRELCSRVTRLFADCVLGFYRRTMRDLHRVSEGQSGTITVVQRVNSDLRLNPHLHLLALDGVFVETDDGQLAFHQAASWCRLRDQSSAR